jgi:hypothetical protein
MYKPQIVAIGLLMNLPQQNLFQDTNLAHNDSAN